MRDADAHETGKAVGVSLAASDAQGEAPIGPPHRGRRARLRPHLRSADESSAGRRGVDGDSELEVELMLLREENARLKVAHHRSSDIGAVIDQIRGLAVADADPQAGAEVRELDGDRGDEIWTALSELLVIREGLEQVCDEMESAIGAVRERIRSLTMGVGAWSAPRAAGCASDPEAASDPGVASDPEAMGAGAGRAVGMASVTGE